MKNTFKMLLGASVLWTSIGTHAQSGPQISYAPSYSGKVNTLLHIVPTIASGSNIASCSISPLPPTGVAFTNKDCVVRGWPVGALATTSYSVKATNTAGLSTTVKFNLNIVPNVPILDYTSSVVKTLKVGESASIIPTYLHNGGSPITSCTISPALPDGLSLNNSTCAITGVPTSVTPAVDRLVKITNAVGSVSPRITIAVVAGTPVLDYTSSTGKTGKVGYTMSITPSLLNDGGSPIKSCVLSPSSPNLPEGLSVDNSTCVISGTVTAPSSSKAHSIRVTNALGYKDAQVTLSVGANFPLLSYNSSTGYVGQELTIHPRSLNPRGANIVQCTGTLPEGLTVNNTTCVISGTPTVVSASKNYSITLRNSAGSSIASIYLGIKAPLPSSKYGTYENPFSRDSAWNVRPVNPVLDTWEIPKDGVNGQNYYPSISSGSFSTGFYKALATDSPMRVYGRAAKNNLIYDTESEANRQYVEIPRWPKDLVAASGGDGHADFLDTVTGVIHSFWQLKYNTTLERWEATTWNTVRIDGTGWGTPAKYMAGARAAGVPTSGGILRKHEVASSDDQFHHAIAMSMAASGLSPAGTGYIYPGTNADWDFAQNNYGKIPEGALMMLPANFDLSKIGRAHTRKIAKTLMTYGARVVDKNSHTPFAMYVEFGSDWPGHKLGSNGWDNVYASDLDKIRAGLKMVVSQSGWIDKDGKPVTMDPNGRGLNFVSLRGDQVVGITATQPSTKAWWKVSGSVLGQYDPVEEKLVWGPTGATPTIQMSANVGNRVAWGKIVSGARYRMTVTATGGAQLNLQLLNADNSLAFQTMYKGQGDLPVEFTGITGTRVRIMAKSGVNVSSSSAKIFVTRID
jgi:hypothetical protein